MPLIRSYATSQTVHCDYYHTTLAAGIQADELNRSLTSITRTCIIIWYANGLIMSVIVGAFFLEEKEDAKVKFSVLRYCFFKVRGERFYFLFGPL